MLMALKDRLTRDEVRAWPPELQGLVVVLEEAQARRNPDGLYSRPEPAYSLRLNALRALIGRAEWSASTTSTAS
jgi:hypothetical protein